MCFNRRQTAVRRRRFFFFKKSSPVRVHFLLEAYAACSFVRFTMISSWRASSFHPPCCSPPMTWTCQSAGTLNDHPWSAYPCGWWSWWSPHRAATIPRLNLPGSNFGVSAHPTTVRRPRPSPLDRSWSPWRTRASTCSMAPWVVDRARRSLPSGPRSDEAPTAPARKRIGTVCASVFRRTRRFAKTTLPG